MDRAPWDRALPPPSPSAPYWDDRSPQSSSSASHHPMHVRASRDPRLARSPPRDPRVSRSPPRDTHLHPRSPLKGPRISRSPSRDPRLRPSHDRDPPIHHAHLDNQQHHQPQHQEQPYQHESPVHFQPAHSHQQQQYRPHGSPVHAQHPPLHVTLPPRARDDASSTTGSVASGETSGRNRDWKRERLLRKKVLPLHEFKRIRKLKLKLEVVKDGDVVPIPVALEPGESKQEYEALLQEWLRGRGVVLSDLRNEPDRERIYRTAYANSRTTPYYKPRASKDVHSSDYEPRGRAAMEDGDGEQEGGGYVRKRSLSPYSDSYDRPPLKVHVKHHSQHSSSSRDHQYSGSSTSASHSGHSKRSSSPSARSPDGSAKSSSQPQGRPFGRCRAQLPASGASFRSFVTAYLRCYCFDCLRDWNLKLTDRLEALETEVRDLRKRVPDDRSAADKKASHRDRPSQETKKTSPKEPSSSTKTGTNGVKEPSKTVTNGVKESSSAKAGTSGPNNSSRSANATTDDQQKRAAKSAARVVSESKSKTASSFSKNTPASSGAQVSNKDSEGKQKPETVVGTTLASVSENARVSVPPTTASSSKHDCTRRDPVDTEFASNVVQSHGQNDDQAMTTPKSRSGSPADVQAETPSTYQKAPNTTDTASEPASTTNFNVDQVMTEKSLDELMIERSVKAQMTGEYDSINQQILNNEKVLQDAVEQLQQRMVTDMHGALRQQEQIQQLRQSIFDDMGHRDAAMAMLIAYCWVGKHDELMDRITQLGMLDVPHVQRVGHVKCAELASQFAERAVELSLWQAKLAAAMMANDGDGSGTVDNLRLAEDVKSQAARAEAELATLEEERMEQFMRLFQFSHRIRATCKSMLEA